MRSKDNPVFAGKTDSEGNLIPKENSASLIAEKINADLIEQIQTGSIDTIEAAGSFALSSLLTQVSGGLLDPKDEFAFLKSLAEKKTQNPVQRVEQTTKVDLKVSIAEAIESSPEALERTLAIAKKHNEEVRERLGGDLMLDGNSKEVLATVNPDEPYEMRDLRTGGDGSMKIQSFKERINDDGRT